MLAVVENGDMEGSVAAVVRRINISSHFADHVNHQVVAVLGSHMYSMATIFVFDRI